jgi:hypothetical protein
MKGLFAPLLLLSLWACGHASPTPSAPVDAGTEDDSGRPFPCESSGLSKGPWVLHVDGTSAVVRWETCRPFQPLGVSVTPEAGGATQKFTADETLFEVTHTFTPLGVGTPPDYLGLWYMHEASLTGLKPSTCYAYGLDVDASVKARFCTARNPGDTVRFLAIGDTNPALGYSTRDVMTHTVNLGWDFTLHTGDIEYYDSLVETYAYWFELMPPLLRQGAFFPAIGNHDSDDQSGEPDDKFEQYTSRFWGDAGTDGGDEDFAYESGGVWFLSFDTELPVTEGTEQYAWLKQELAKASASAGYRFSIVYFHRPFMTCGDSDDHLDSLAALQPLFTQYRVPLVLAGHMHGYERFVTPTLTEIVTGGGGGALGDVNANSTRSYCNERVASGLFYNAVYFEILPGMLTGKVVDDQGNTRDTFSMSVP